ncbi:MAG TPA: ferritin family protein [Bacteroidales bacterium]|nr:ferritin family protein [Bacteroidales bacterium]HSA44577.1 ferritin family protein [Bacteroidales bacterium]
MDNLKGSRTEQNLLKSFAGESQAARRYRLFAETARQEGYEQIAAIFEETARQEDQHSKVFFSFLQGGMLEITAAYPAGIVSGTAENLAAAAMGENEEWSDLYPEFAGIAEEEGFKKIATAYKLIASVEKRHEERYRKLHENVINSRVFEKEEETEWTCRQCGYVYKGKKALKNCPCCDHPQAFFEVAATNY